MARRRPTEDLSRSLGPQLIHWAETFLPHGPGDLQGLPLTFDNDVCRFVARQYALDEDGRKLYREAFYSRAKGCAKSELAGAEVVWEFIGPCRFDHWAEPGEVSYWGYEYAPGEPVGRPVVSPFIRVLATEEEQTGNTYDNVAFMLDTLNKGDHTHLFPKIDIGRSWQASTRVFLEGGGEIRPSTAGAASKDGGKETFAVADETHLYVTGELRRMFQTVQRNTGKRKQSEPHLLQTSTMYAPGEDSIAERTHKAFEEGALPGVLFDHVQGPKVNLRHTNKLREALKISYGFRPWIDYEALVALAQDPRTEESEVFRYWLNRPTVAENAWLDPESVKRCVRLDGADFPAAKTAITLGFDGSLTDDWTALVGTELISGHTFVIEFWRPDYYGGEIDPADVDDAVRWAFTQWNVVLMYADPAHWGSWVALWARELGDKIVREFWTHRETEMARATEEMHTAIVSGQITLADQPTMRSHFLHCRRRRHAAGTLVRKEHRGSANKIDIAVAAILAYAARNKALAAGLGKRRSGKVVVYT